MDDNNTDRLIQKIATIFDEARTSYATHNRKLKELSLLRSKFLSISQFFSAFSQTLTPLFDFQRRIASADRVVSFVSAFAAARDPARESDSDEFLELFLKFLLVAAVAANKTARFRACQIVSEIILRLPDDAEVSNEVWDEVIECMKLRIGDKIPLVRTLAIRALSRFVNDTVNSDILALYLEQLPLEQNADVRKMIVLSLPPSTATSQVIIDCTLDVSESVRKAAYRVLANKFPLHSLSIKLRTLILRRGLADRSAAVSKECFKLLKDEWLVKCSNGNPLELLKYLDVETYESVGESVMEALLEADLVKLQSGASIQQYISSNGDTIEGDSLHCQPSIQLMEAEAALYWRTVCKHLQSEAHAKGSDAAATMGTEAEVYASEASDKNDLLEKILPVTVSDYIELVRAHINAGSNHRFACRQLLLLGVMFDFSDATNRKAASAFLHEMMCTPPEHEVDNEGNVVIIGDGLSFGCDNDWAEAVARLARKVHATPGGFEEVILAIIEELAQPCRERTADFVQWIHTLSLTGLLLKNAKSLRLLQGKAIEPDELLQSLLLPGAKHAHLNVQRIAVRCLGLFGLLERKPSAELLKQLRISYIKGPHPISIEACKALMDLGMWHDPQEVDRVLKHDNSCQINCDKKSFSPVNFSESEGDLDVGLLDLLYGGFEKDDWASPLTSNEDECVYAVLGEGFAKILLLSENYPSIPDSLHPVLLSKLIYLYFSDASEHLQRLKQCLSVFFEHYSCLSANHKRCITKTFIPVMRSMWPGIFGNRGGSPFMVSQMRKRAVQASRFMLQMMQVPLYVKETQLESENSSVEHPQVIDSSGEVAFECGEEGLALRLAIEVVSFHSKKTAAEKAYVSALCKTLVLLHFRLSEQQAIKLMRRLLILMLEHVSSEKDLVKELKHMAEHLTTVDRQLNQELLQDDVNLILGKLEVDFNLDLDNSVAMLPQTPAAPPTRPTRRRRVRIEEEDSSDEASPASEVPTTHNTVRCRSERASKTAALNKMSARRSLKTDEIDETEDQEEVDSDVTSEDYDGSE
ncbi:PREDICTED: condensin complex subunit 3 [Lupinus angustifolius]|uniref:condensin complex subunit 3 n=1 Tax=Lupinus angustifolius TaxID=3871 RepID=UPI00092EF2C9|nr:PREDICTED: condensin complex subunit 3 [Lupinus angustifolius]